MTTMREQVARAIWVSDNKQMWATVPWEELAHTFQDDCLRRADTALTTILTALAAEAKRRTMMQGSPMFYENGRWYSVEDWLLSHLPIQPEVRDGE